MAKFSFKPKGKLNIKDNAIAFGGGLASALIIDKLDDMTDKDKNPIFVGDKEMLPPLIAAASGLILGMYAPKMQSLAYGIVGGAGAQMYPSLADKLGIGSGAANGDTSTINAVTKQRAGNIIKMAMMKKAQAGRAFGNKMLPQQSMPTHRAMRDTGRVGGSSPFNLSSLAMGYSC
jgi:hypothetical protein